MKLTFENAGTNTYLVYEIDAADDLDTMSLGMLTNNSIPGFAQTAFQQLDTTKYIKFNVSAKISADQLFSGPVNKKRLLAVFSGVTEALLSAEDYMLDPRTVLLDLSSIFVDVSTSATELICLPVTNPQHVNPEPAAFFKNILFTTQFDQSENCDHVAQLINYLNAKPNLVLEEFKELLDKLAGQGAVQPRPQAQPAVQPVQPAVQPVQPAVQPVQSVQPQVQPQVKAQPVRTEPVAVPDGVKKPVPVPAGAKKPEPPKEKPMSMFYLLQHYNKENAAIYKAQQEAAKAQKTAAQPAKKQPAPKKGHTPAAGIAIPGQEVPQVEIPGQSAKPVQPAVQPVIQQVEPYEPIYQPELAYSAQQAEALNFGETTVLSNSFGETTVLDAVPEYCKPTPHLIRAKNNERIPVNKPLFRLGKEKSYADYCISDNPAISRSHANIIERGGEYFVVDTNSTNHTYVDGVMLQSNQETKLSDGAKLRLGNEDFEFKLY